MPSDLPRIGIALTSDDYSRLEAIAKANSRSVNHVCTLHLRSAVTALKRRSDVVDTMRWRADNHAGRHVRAEVRLDRELRDELAAAAKAHKMPLASLCYGAISLFNDALSDHRTGVAVQVVD